MKIAVPSISCSLESYIDHRCIRGHNYIIYDDSDKTWFPLEIQCGQEGLDSQSIYAARELSSLGVKTLISGHCRPWVTDIFHSYDILVYQGAEGKIKEILGDFKSGKYIGDLSNKKCINSSIIK